MRNLTKALGCCAIASVITACGGSGSVADPSSMTGPSYNSGFGMGSGQRTVPADTTPVASANSTTSTTSDDSGERGGFGMGSGQ